MPATFLRRHSAWVAAPLPGTTELQLRRPAEHLAQIQVRSFDGRPYDDHLFRWWRGMAGMVAVEVGGTSSSSQVSVSWGQRRVLSCAGKFGFDLHSMGQLQESSGPRWRRRDCLDVVWRHTGKEVVDYGY